MNIGIILAGGIGSRVGLDKPKQFIEILNKPVIAYTIEKFQMHSEIDAIEVVCHNEWIEYLNELVKKYNFDKVKWVTPGGDTFQKSVYNGIRNLEGKISADDIVLIHFGASPFLEDDIISDAIKVCKIRGNAISTTDFYVLSAIKKSTNSVNDPNNFSEQYIDRDTIACMSSPHAFIYDFVNKMYKEAIETNVINEVEPHTTTLMQKMGKPIYFSKGSQTNIKIACKEDLDLFEGYILMKRLKEKNEV